MSAETTIVRKRRPRRNDMTGPHGPASKNVARSDKSADESIPHGTAGGYTNHGCSCNRCAVAWAETCMTAKERRKAKGLEPGDKRHGTENGYSNWGCSCDECREAHNASKRRYTAERRRRD